VKQRQLTYTLRAGALHFARPEVFLWLGWKNWALVRGKVSPGLVLGGDWVWEP
jgi:hypothetical protein